MTSRFKIKIMRASCHPNCQSKKTLRQQETVAHLCNLPRQPFILPFAIRLKTLEQLSLRVSSERASERLTVDRVYPPSSTYETIICWWSAFTMRPVAAETRNPPIPRPPLTGIHVFRARNDARAASFSSTSSPVFLVERENVRLEDTENEIFSTAVTLSLSLLLRAVFYPLPPPSRSLSLSLPTAPSPSRSAPHAPRTCERFIVRRSLSAV